MVPKPPKRKRDQDGEDFEVPKGSREGSSGRTTYVDEESGPTEGTECGPEDAFFQSDSVMRNADDETRSEISESDSNDNEDLLYDDLEEAEPRFLNPSIYFRQLEQLEHNIYDQSAFKLWSSSWQIESGSDTKSQRESLTKFLESVMPHDTAAQTAQIYTSTGSNSFLHWVTCRSVLLNARENVRLLQEAEYCRDFFSVLSLDPDRSEIVRLRTISLSTVDQLVSEFETNFQKLFQRENSWTSISSLLSDSHVATCRSILDEAGLLPKKEIPVESLWRHTVHLLDLGVLSYAGAHIERIDKKYIGDEVAEIPLFSQMYTTVTNVEVASPSAIKFNQRNPSVINVRPKQSVYINIRPSTQNSGVDFSANRTSTPEDKDSGIETTAAEMSVVPGVKSAIPSLKSARHLSTANSDRETYIEVRPDKNIHTELEPNRCYSLQIKPQMPVAVEIKPSKSALIYIKPNSRWIQFKSSESLNVDIKREEPIHVEIESEESLSIHIKPMELGRDELKLQPFLSLQRRRLQCLDRFLGSQEIWAFGQPNEEAGITNTTAKAGRLYLSANIKSLSDIWGPAWGVKESESQSQIISYQIGNGIIVPWSDLSDHTNIPASVGNHDEIVCHWISYQDRNDADLREYRRTTARKYFLPEDILLIGADLGLHVNEDCKTSVEHIKNHLRQINALKIPETSQERHYVDGYTVQVSASAAGFGGISGSLTYKRRNGFSMKSALVESWRNKRRNIKYLEIFAGVEISLCTRNARRRRLWQILRSRTMLDFLKATSFEWKDEACERAYYEALSEAKHFRRRFENLWNDKNYCMNIGDAISACLNALMKTGVNEDTGELSAFWVWSTQDSNFDQEIDSEMAYDSGNSSGVVSDMNSDSRSKAPRSAVRKYEEWAVSLFRHEHTWTGLLRDSRETATFAIVDEICLRISKNSVLRWERCCLESQESLNGRLVFWTPGDPVLQTSLLVNESVLGDSDGGLRRRDPRRSECKSGEDGRAVKQYWDIDQLKENYNFSLGAHGSLKVDQRNGQRLIMKWKPTFSETLHNWRQHDILEKMLGKQQTPHHQEYITGEWGMQPLPILVRSSRSKLFQRASGLGYN